MLTCVERRFDDWQELSGWSRSVPSCTINKRLQIPPRVYVFLTIFRFHVGEVEGDVAMNMLVRDMVPQQSTPMDEVDLEQIAMLFSTLANSARLAIFCRIIEREWSVNDLADEVGLRQSALSQHLRKLRDAKVVKTRRERQIVYYRCADATVLRLLSQVGLIGSEQLITELPSI